MSLTKQNKTKQKKKHIQTVKQTNYESGFQLNAEKKVVFPPTTSDADNSMNQSEHETHTCTRSPERETRVRACDKTRLVWVYF